MARDHRRDPLDRSPAPARARAAGEVDLALAEVLESPDTLRLDALATHPAARRARLLRRRHAIVAAGVLVLAAGLLTLAAPWLMQVPALHAVLQALGCLPPTVEPRATEHIAGMDLKKYFASYNRITDRTPELLSGIETLEEVTFDSCAGLTNAGITALARLPRLRKLAASGMRSVTREATTGFAPGVAVRYAP